MLFSSHWCGIEENVVLRFFRGEETLRGGFLTWLFKGLVTGFLSSWRAFGGRGLEII
jgi:hypothetical protein